MTVINDIYDIVPCGYDGVQASLNVLSYKVTLVTGAGPTDQEIADNFDATLSHLYKALFADTAEYVGLRARKISPGGLGIVAKSVAGAGAGTAGPVGLPTGVSGLIQKNTAAPGRRGFGHCYVGFPAAADNTGDGIPTSGYVTRLAALAAQLEASFLVVGAGGTANFVPGVWSRKFSSFGIATLYAPAPFWATQRRRSHYGRPNASPI